MLKKITPYAKEFFQRADILLLSLCVISSLISIAVISSATATSDEGSFRYVFVQSFALIIGVGLFVLLTVIDLDVWADKWPLLLAFCILLIYRCYHNAVAYH